MLTVPEKHQSHHSAAKSEELVNLHAFGSFGHFHVLIGSYKKKRKQIRQCPSKLYSGGHILVSAELKNNSYIPHMEHCLSKLVTL